MLLFNKTTMDHNCTECSRRADGRCVCSVDDDTSLAKSTVNVSGGGGGGGNQFVGSINMLGYLHGLYAKGFTPQKCLGELLANSLDPSVGASNVECRIDGVNHIFITDDGVGMDKTDITNMFDMHRSNHSGDKSMGRSGIGGRT